MITQKELKRLFSYNPDTGIFIRKKSISGAKHGENAGNINPNGYVYITINRKPYFAHRLAWLYIKGSFPEGFLDHINKNQTDNRFSNLRESTNQQNQYNTSVSKNNKTGFKGVSIHKPSKKYTAYIAINGKNKNLGYFNDAREASIAYQKEAKKLHGSFYCET